MIASIIVLAVSAVPSASASNLKQLRLPPGFEISVIARIDSPRELAIAPNGDLFAGTRGSNIMIVRDAEGTSPAPAQVFAHVNDSPLAGVALTNDTLYIAGQFGVWRLPYKQADRTPVPAKPERISKVRPGGGGGHSTTSIAVSGQKLYVSVGSICDACDETDPTRATVQETGLSGGTLIARAIHIRNAVALTSNPDTGHIWALPNGQDALAAGHPFEFGDPITTHAGVADYGWPNCYENRRKVKPSVDCSKTVIPRLILPAYNAPMGAVIYPKTVTGKYAFPKAYAGGLFVGLHGSWHMPLVPPRVAFVALDADMPKIAPDWNDPAKQWHEFLGGFQNADGSRTGRPTGVAVGPEGSLFIADDSADVIYRVRYTGGR